MTNNITDWACYEQDFRDSEGKDPPLSQRAQPVRSQTVLNLVRELLLLEVRYLGTTAVVGYLGTTAVLRSYRYGTVPRHVRRVYTLECKVNLVLVQL